MQLQELIDALETYDPSIVVREGFAKPHSYRGYYEQLAFEPAYGVTIGSMLDAARSAVGATYHGYKGGSYTMEKWTLVHLANYGECGDELSERLLRYMLADRAAVMTDHLDALLTPPMKEPTWPGAPVIARCSGDDWRYRLHVRRNDDPDSGWECSSCVFTEWRELVNPRPLTPAEYAKYGIPVPCTHGAGG